MTKQVSVRQRLLDAAYSAMGSKGFETSRIVDIIEAAGVGVGSFYNHFSGKENLARAVFLSRVDAFGKEMEAAVVSSSDSAASLCFVYRRLIDRAERDYAWAAFILQLEPLFRMFDRLMRPHARVGLQIGIDNGTFRIDDLEAGVTAVHAMMLAVTQAMLIGDLSRQKAHRSSKLALCMFGVPEARAAKLSRMTMVALRAAMGIAADEH
ncbi:TetR/AcrR family transcriptional regulator [Sphingomonas bacterium]|uniref:TetR/AcrR family transcriptional regulator n=1 Tax=Sphingomonas bacterium TaxID=1895847 RepID=UPI001575A6B1|nr:TetR/AcrR family transcriptional regulator [Sphingomonas bacterium]